MNRNKKFRIVMMAVRSALLVLAGALIGRALGDPLGGALIFALIAAMCCVVRLLVGR